jgi:hypothetical protein
VSFWRAGLDQRPLGYETDMLRPATRRHRRHLGSRCHRCPSAASTCSWTRSRNRATRADSMPTTGTTANRRATNGSPVMRSRDRVMLASVKADIWAGMVTVLEEAGHRPQMLQLSRSDLTAALETYSTSSGRLAANGLRCCFTICFQTAKASAWPKVAAVVAQRVAQGHRTLIQRCVRHEQS